MQGFTGAEGSPGNLKKKIVNYLEDFSQLNIFLRLERNERGPRLPGTIGNNDLLIYKLNL
jgi:hypothetical protein